MDKQLQQLIADHKDKQGGDLVSLLNEIQDKYGYLPSDVLSQVASALEIPLSRIYGTSSFYTFFSHKPQGKNVIRICKGIPCDIKAYQEVVEALEVHLGIKPGQTTADKKFTLELVNCIGACDQAPAMLVNDKVYGNLTPAKVPQILKEYA